MKRLTKRSTVDKEMVWFVDKENEDFNLEPCEMDSHHSRLAIQKLAAYEDTGLTPEQVVEMDRLYREKCEEVAKMKAELKAKENS